MSIAPRTQPPIEKAETIADLLNRLGDIPAHRVRLHPTPGTATETDLLKVNDAICELVDGTLVEKPMGYEESAVAVEIGRLVGNFVRPRKLGIVTGADGTLGLRLGLVRVPDVAYIPYDRLPGRKMPKEPIPKLAPDLAIEVLSKSNTKKEMARKLQEYFEAGTRLVWLVDPKKRTVRVHSSPETSILLDETSTLDGGGVLPGFTLAVRDLFAVLDEQG